MNSRVEGVYWGKSVTKMEMMMTKMEMMILIHPSEAESIIVE